MTKKKSHRKKWIGLGITLVVILLLATAARLALKSVWLFDIVRNIAAEQVNQQINGTISIEAIRGDLLKGFTIKQVTLAGEDGAEIARIDSVALNYRLFSLLRGPHQLDDLSIYGADVWITQHADSTWNVLNLVDEEETDPEAAAPLYWAVSHADISGANIYITSDHLLPDGFLNITGLNAGGSGGMVEDGFYGNLDALEFQLEEARLPEPIALYIQGSGSEEKYTLESLVINTGRTILQTTASYEEDGPLDQTMEVTPLSWRDLAVYAEDLPLQQDLTISLSAAGSLADLRLSINLAAAGAENMTLSAGFDLSDEPALKHAEFTSKELNLPLLTGMADWPVFTSIHLQGSGTIVFDDWENALFEGELLAEGLSLEPYSLERIQSDFMLGQGHGQMGLQLNHQGEEIRLNAAIRNVFDEMPAWQADVRANNWNPALWLADEAYEADLNLRFDIEGEGVDPDNFRADMNALVEGNRYGLQPFSEIRFSGALDPQQAGGTFSGRLDKSQVETTFGITGWRENPHYTFNLALKEFNTAELEGLAHFPTYINGSFKGEGRSFDIDELNLVAEMEFDSSIVNGEVIEAFRADLRMENRVAFIEQGVLQSPIADATFSLRHHTTDVLNEDNRLQFQGVLKDLYPIAPLFGFEELEAEGTFHGRLARNDTGILQFDGGFEFENILVDTLFSSTKMSSTITSYLHDEPEVVAALELIEPTVFNTEMQDFHLNTTAVIKESETTGALDFMLRNGDESSLFHAGEFQADSTKMVLKTNQLIFDTRLKTLSLLQPFDLTYSDEILRMDTLAISSGDEDAYLKLWIPHLDTLHQQAGLDARNLNLGELQQTVINQSYLDGFLSGTIEFANSPNNLELTATGLLRSIKYEEGQMDSLRFDATLADEWLNAELNGWQDNNRVVDGYVRVPFLPGDPQTFDDQFFEREVSGRFHIPETGLGYWLAFMPEGGPEQTAGRVSVEAVLSGLAGKPELSGGISVTEGLFSGISLDSVGIQLDYLHENGTVDFNGNVMKDQKSILSFDATLPFLADLRQAEILLPSDDDEVHLNFRTDDFDMALFNSYIDPGIVRNIAGRIEGNVTLSGTIADLQTNGELRVSGGRMRVVEAGITLNEISSNILFEPDKITLRQFSMSSGPGRLQANGTVALDAMEPGEMNLEVRANQFRAINTAEYNFLINLQSRLEGTFNEPRLRGNIAFLTGLVNLQDFGDRTVEAVVLEEEEETEPFEFYETLAMEMNVDFGRQFLIRNRQYLDMDLALTGSLDLLKDPYEEIQLFGTLEGTRGFVRPLGRNFELDEAVVSFFGPADNPQMNIRTRYEPPQAAGVIIFYVIDGTLQDPEFHFESNPELELQDIVSYTLFGKPFYDLDSWEQVVAGSGSSPTAADVALDVLLDRVEMLASQRLGIDVVQIDNTRSGSNNTTSIKTGWYLNQRTFFAILNEVGGARPKTLFMLEYLLRDNLELIITQGDDSREGVDLRWKLDY